MKISDHPSRSHDSNGDVIIIRTILCCFLPFAIPHENDPHKQKNQKSITPSGCSIINSGQLVERSGGFNWSQVNHKWGKIAFQFLFRGPVCALFRKSPKLMLNVCFKVLCNLGSLFFDCWLNNWNCDWKKYWSTFYSGWNKENPLVPVDRNYLFGVMAVGLAYHAVCRNV